MKDTVMPDINFIGRAKLVALLDAAVSQGDEHQVTAALRNALCHIIPDSEILLKRSLTYTESAALAKEQEESFLYRAMQSDIVSQVMRRLASRPSISGIWTSIRTRS